MPSIFKLHGIHNITLRSTNNQDLFINDKLYMNKAIFWELVHKLPKFLYQIEVLLGQKLSHFNFRCSRYEDHLQTIFTEIDKHNNIEPWFPQIFLGNKTWIISPYYISSLHCTIDITIQECIDFIKGIYILLHSDLPYNMCQCSMSTIFLYNEFRKYNASL